MLNKKPILQQNKVADFSFHEVKNIGFIFESINDEQISFAYRFGSENWPKARKNLLAFNEGQVEDSLHLISIFNKKSFNWLGKIKDPQLKGFLDEKFDLVVDFSSTENEWIAKIYPHLHTKFLIGSYESERFDFSVSTGLDDLDVFGKTMIKFLKIINTQ